MSAPDVTAVLVSAAPPIDRGTTDRSLIHGVAWTGLMKTSGQVVAWVSTIVVARMLSPDDFGIVGMATLYLGLLQLVSEFGIGSAIVTRRELTPDQIAQLNTVSVLMGAAGAAIVAGTAPLVGAFFHNDKLPPVLTALGLTFFISSFRSVPWGLLQRDLRFKRIAMYDGAQSVLLGALSVLLAWMGFRYWTLVIAALASAAMGTAIAVTQHAVPLRRPRVRQLRHALTFSRNIVAQRAAWYGYTNADFLVAGRMLGSAQLGIYTLAWDISHITDKITNLVLQVTPSVLSRVQHDRAELRRYAIRIAEMMALTIMPMMIGLAAVAPDLVSVVLGDKWAPMVVPLQLLSAYATVNVVLPLFSQVLNATGHEGFGAQNNVIQLVVMSTAFAIGARLGGVLGIALAWVLVHPFVGIRIARYTLRSIDLPARVFVRQALLPAMLGCIVMSAAAVGIRHGVPDDVPRVLRLALEITGGAVSYVVTLLVLHGPELRTKRAAMRELFGR